MKKTKDWKQQQKMAAEVSQIASQTNLRQQKIKAGERKAAVKAISREMVQKGHKPYYFKKSDIKKVDLAAKYQELKKSGGSSKVNRLIEKKRKRNASKVHKYVPYEARREHG